MWHMMKSAAFYVLVALKEVLPTMAIQATEEILRLEIVSFDATSFEEIDSFHLGPYEIILLMISMKLKVTEEASKSSEEKGDQDSRRPFLIGTAYGMPGENEPSRGRIIVLKCTSGNDKSSITKSSASC